METVLPMLVIDEQHTVGGGACLSTDLAWTANRQPPCFCPVSEDVGWRGARRGAGGGSVSKMTLGP